jgi:NADPH:quinone reductase-like Zn-dependent oxidoreductase/3-oxoacyl-(acyl-carrier-protein) synthase/acyl carrier protein
MSADAQPTPLTRALGTIKSLKEQLAQATSAEPIAIVGVGVRLPGGVADLGSLWEAVLDGRSAIGPLPAGRRGPHAAGWAQVSDAGNYFDDVMGFDAEFFGIADDDARAMDPRQRLMLEVAWEALEDAGIAPLSDAAADCGLYIGVTGDEYASWGPAQPTAGWAAGNGHSMAAGRLAYQLGLSGASLALDTACSSSLVALHLASAALRRGESAAALVGGVNLVLSPDGSRMHQLAGNLSPDGSCHPFDARAHGFARGEGCGFAVLKRLSDAERDGDRIHGLLLGSAVGSTGKSAGFGAPSVAAEAAVISAALAAAQCSPTQIGYVEAHGTGTRVGDAIEMEALSLALGSGPRVWGGSAKGQWGHLEAAAGIVGVLKAMLCVSRRRVPAVCGFAELSPLITLENNRIALPTAPAEWAHSSGPHAGVSAIGAAGSNAHVIVAAAPTPPMPTQSDAVPAEFTISARTLEALREVARRLAATLDGGDGNLHAVAHTLATGRARHPWRADIAAADSDCAAAALRAVSGGVDHSGARVYQHDPWALEEAAVPAGPRAVADLPAYPWQRKRLAPADAPSRRPHAGASFAPQHHSAGADALVPGAFSSRAFSCEADENFQLICSRPGIAASVAPVLCGRPEPGPSQIEIRVSAGAVNFSDALKAAGAYPGWDHQGPLGIEAAGRVTRVGSQVSGFAPGDEVVALCDAALSGYALADERLSCLRPGNLDPAAAAAIPVAYATAWFGLEKAASLRDGESVVIHSAAGGVGRAAIELARAAGARVYATAGSEEKRRALRDIGVEHVFDSHTAHFEEQLRELEPRGVDVVLNSLSGELLSASLRLLAPGGRFVELGKRDIYSDAAIPLSAFREGRSFAAVDFEQTRADDPELLGDAISELISRVADGQLALPPLTLFPYSAAGEAFAHMTSGRHQGKIVLTGVDAHEGMRVLQPGAQTGASPAGAGESAAARAAVLAVAPGPSRTAAMARIVAPIAAEVLGVPASSLDPAAPLADAGFSSLRMLELRTSLEAALGLELPATVGWRFPTLTALCEHLADQIAADAGAERDTGTTQSALPAHPAAEPAPDGASVPDSDIESLLLATLDLLEEGRNR